MIKSKILISAFAATLCYTLISFACGRNGIFRYRHLQEEKKRVSVQATLIQSINDELNLELTALQNDKDLIASYARKLDYVKENEKIIKIKGLKPIQKNLYDAGTIVRHTEEEFVSESVCKGISMVIFFLTFIILFLVDLQRGAISFKKEKTVIQGIPVYEMPQI